MPSPRNPAGLTGHVFNVATDDDRRRRGYARQCMEALVAWFRDDTAVGRVELHASAYGLALYRSLGFAPSAEPALQLAFTR
jgi:ribosomal protein S18 acetylase RimI-like enzyme